MKRVLIEFIKKGFIGKIEYEKGREVSVLPCIAQKKVNEKVAKIIKE
jgi:hypothetical protein